MIPLSHVHVLILLHHHQPFHYSLPCSRFSSLTTIQTSPGFPPLPSSIYSCNSTISPTFHCNQSPFPFLFKEKLQQAILITMSFTITTPTMAALCQCQTCNHKPQNHHHHLLCLHQITTRTHHRWHLIMILSILFSAQFTHESINHSPLILCSSFAGSHQAQSTKPSRHLCKVFPLLSLSPVASAVAPIQSRRIPAHLAVAAAFCPCAATVPEVFQRRARANPALQSTSPSSPRFSSCCSLTPAYLKLP